MHTDLKQYIKDTRVNAKEEKKLESWSGKMKEKEREYRAVCPLMIAMCSGQRGICLTLIA